MNKKMGIGAFAVLLMVFLMFAVSAQIYLTDEDLQDIDSNKVYYTENGQYQIAQSVQRGCPALTGSCVANTEKKCVEHGTLACEYSCTAAGTWSSGTKCPTAMCESTSSCTGNGEPVTKPAALTCESQTAMFLSSNSCIQ